MTTDQGAAIDVDAAVERLLAGRLADPHGLLGPHVTGSTTVVRAFHPEATAASLAREAGVTVNIYPRQGDPADAILDVAEERDADLIIVGNKGMTGAKRFLLGSVPNKVSHYAPCSVLIIRTT